MVFSLRKRRAHACSQMISSAFREPTKKTELKAVLFTFNLAINPPYQVTFSADSFLKKYPDGVVTISAPTNKLLQFVSTYVCIAHRLANLYRPFMPNAVSTRLCK